MFSSSFNVLSKLKKKNNAVASDDFVYDDTVKKDINRDFTNLMENNKSIYCLSKLSGLLMYVKIFIIFIMIVFKKSILLTRRSKSLALVFFRLNLHF